MEYTNKLEYRIIHWKGTLEDDKMILYSYLENITIEPIYYHR